MNTRVRHPHLQLRLPAGHPLAARAEFDRTMAMSNLRRISCAEPPVPAVPVGGAVGGLIGALVGCCMHRLH
jgi:hypothetical protein